MLIKDIVEIDLVNYKKPSMFIIFPTCSFKCDKEYGTQICQNCDLAKAPNISITYEEIVDRYLNNPVSKAIVMGGLEPYDSYYDLCLLIKKFREKTQDEIIIYTGYTEKEIAKIDLFDIWKLRNIIIKYGRYIPNQKPYYDEELGVELASDNQYARRMS